MKRAFIYKDEKSHKFWCIDYSGYDFSVNYGKSGSIGKFEIKEFETEEECLKQAEKLIRSKEKKGYVEDTGFDFMNKIYIDSEEYGLHPKTSHPRFTEHFTEELYYDCVDEEAPFGSDEGSDTLDSLEETIRKNPKLNFLDFPKYLIEHDWGMEYIPVESLDPEVVKKLASKKEMDMTQSDMVTYATAFGQIKITPHFNQPMVKTAPVVLTFCIDLRRFTKWCEQRKATPGYNNLEWFVTGSVDALLAAQTFCVAAEEKGLGICYLGTTTYNPQMIIEALELPELVFPITTVTVGWPAEEPAQVDRLPLEAIVHEETYHDYTPEDIDRLYAYKESLPENKQFIAENNKETLAQVFTDVRYTKKDSEAMSENLWKVMKQQGF